MQFEVNIENKFCSVFGLEKILGLHEKDGTDENVTGKVKFTVDIEARSWGIKTISVYATSFESTIEYENWDEDNRVSGTIAVKDGIDGWKLKSDMNLNGEMATVNNIDIDFKTKIIHVF